MEGVLFLEQDKERNIFKNKKNAKGVYWIEILKDSFGKKKS